MTKRDGEVELAFDPDAARPDAGVVFIGQIRSPWTSREECPKNMAAARERGRPALIIIDAAYRRGLEGLDGFSHAIVLTWLDRAPRNLIVQNPRHAGAPRGIFALRSPARPNPVGVHVTRIVHIDPATGEIAIEAIDVLDETPVIDVKPYFASADAIPEAAGGRGAPGQGTNDR